MKPFLKYSIWTKLFTHWLYWKISFVRLSKFFFFIVFIALISMLIYGMGYFPLFAGITASSPLGYFVATMFTWCFAAEFFANSFCRQNFDVSVCCYKHFHACTMFMYLGNAWKKWRVYSHWTLRSVWTKFVTFTEVHLQFFKILM